MNTQNSTDKGKMLVNLGSLTIDQYSFNELDILSTPFYFTAKVASLSNPIRIVTYDKKLINKINECAINNEPLNNLLQMKTYTNLMYNKQMVQYCLSDMDIDEHATQFNINHKAETVYTRYDEIITKNDSKLRSYDIKSIPCYIEGYISKENVEITRDNKDNIVLKGTITSADNNINFSIQIDDAREFGLDDVVSSLSNDKLAHIRISANTHNSYEDNDIVLNIDTIHSSTFELCDNPQTTSVQTEDDGYNNYISMLKSMKNDAEHTVESEPFSKKAMALVVMSITCLAKSISSLSEMLKVHSIDGNTTSMESPSPCMRM